MQALATNTVILQDMFADERNKNIIYIIKFNKYNKIQRDFKEISKRFSRM